MENKIAQLKAVPEINSIVVSSDSERMLSIAREAGVEGVRRPVEYCDEHSKSFNEVVEYIARYQVKSKIMMWVPCVCPLVGSRKIAEGITLFQKCMNGELQADSIATAAVIKEYLFDEKGPINFDIEHHVPSQRLPNWHYITNGFFIARREDMAKWRFVYGPHPYLFEVDKFESIDIDDEYDFRLAEMAMKIKNTI